MDFKNIKIRKGDRYYSRKQQSKRCKTDKGDFYSDKVVNACGSYSAQIGKMVGLNIPIKPRKGQLIISEPIGPFMEATVQCARYTWIKLKYRTNKRRYPNYRWHS
ncbi:FAD-dependent oxidoreductase [Intestinibacter bartlettii]|uniref:FAD-dependent oxidoreductase n=1 Tax=Intestinibacter bartlettii TaxID=261299 RepID=UPI00352210E8